MRLIVCCICGSPTTQRSPQYAGTNHRLWWDDRINDAFHPDCVLSEIGRLKMESDLDLSPFRKMIGLDGEKK